MHLVYWSTGSACWCCWPVSHWRDGSDMWRTMISCATCDKRVSYNDIRCPHCGIWFGEDICRECGGPIKNGAIWCISCGAVFGKAVALPADPLEAEIAAIRLLTQTLVSVGMPPMAITAPLIAPSVFGYSFTFTMLDKLCGQYGVVWDVTDDGQFVVWHP